MDFIALIKDLGVPVGIIIAAGLGLWHACCWLSKNVIVPVTEVHINFVRSLQRTNETNTETLKKISETLEMRTTMIATLQEQNKLVIELIKQSSDLPA